MIAIGQNCYSQRINIDCQRIIMNMLSNKIRLLHLILFIVMTQIPCYAQGSLNREIVVTFVSAKCIDTTYTLSPHQTRVYPPRLSYIKDKLVYELRITIKLNGDGFIFDKPLALTCYLPKDGSKTIIVNQVCDTLNPNGTYEYVMVIKTNHKGWSKITIGEWDDYNLRITYFNDIRFIDGSVYLE